MADANSTTTLAVNCHIVELSKYRDARVDRDKETIGEHIDEITTALNDIEELLKHVPHDDSTVSYLRLLRVWRESLWESLGGTWSETSDEGGNAA